uniref:Uncharacterized protein n=1 Tax=Setaria digitata TaxID=48799 RepID=A0A915PLW9_9BILA
MRLHAVMSGVVLLWLTQIRSLSYHIVSSRLSFFTQQHWHNNISEINRLNDCKYSEVRVEAGRKVIIILSETNWCNEALKTIFGKNVEKNWGSGRNVTAFTVPYSYSEPRNLRIKRVEDTYLDSATRAASKLGRIDLICCGRRVPLFESRIQKRSVYGNKLQKHHPFTGTTEEGNVEAKMQYYWTSDNDHVLTTAVLFFLSNKYITVNGTSQVFGRQSYTPSTQLCPL